MREISAHILQVIVATSGPHAFLTVSHTPEACHLTSWIHCAQEDGLELEAHKSGGGGSSVKVKGGVMKMVVQTQGYL